MSENIDLDGMENEIQLRLHRAIDSGDITAAEAAIADGASVNVRVDGQLPVYAAFGSGNMQLVVRLLRHGADLSLPPLDHDGETDQADHVTTSWSIVPKAISQWMRQPPRPADPPKYPGQEICKAFLACKFPKEAVLLALLDQRLLSRDYVERSIVHRDDLLIKLWASAVEMGSVSAVQQFLDLGMPVDVQVQELYAMNAMSVAAHKGHCDVVRVLLERDAKLGSPSTHGDSISSGLTPLIWCLQLACAQASSQDSYLATLEMLLDAGEDANSVDDFQNHRPVYPTALMLAIQSCNHGIASVELLLKRGADSNARDKDGRTPTHYAVRHKEAAELLKMLAEAGADVNVADNKGNTPLLDSVFRISGDAPNPVFVNLLTDFEADVFARNSKGVSALQVVAESCFIDLLGFVLTFVGKQAIWTSADPSLLIAACRRVNDRHQAVRWLLNCGVDVNGIDPGTPWERAPGRTPLHEACSVAAHGTTDQLDTIKTLIQQGADVNARYSDAKRKREDITPIGLVAFHAPSRIKSQALELLLEAGADPNGLDDFGRPAISSLCSLQETVHSARRVRNYGMTHSVARFMNFNLSMYPADLTENEESLSSHEDAIKTLLDHGCDITAIDSERKNCLHHAAESNNAAAIGIIEAHDSKTGNRRVGVASEWSDCHGRRPLHLACEDDNWTTHSGSERSGESMSSSVPRSPLPYLRKQCTRSSKTLQELHKLDVDLYAVDNHGASALHTAARVGNPRIAAWLLLATGPGLVYGHEDDLGRLAAHYAVNSVTVTRLLLTFDQTGRVEHEQYFGVEKPDVGHCAYVRTQEQAYEKQCLQSRQDAGKGPQGGIPEPWWRGYALDVDQLGNSPLHYAALIGNADVLRAYLEIPDVDISAQNKDGETVLDFAEGNRACEAAILEKYPELATARHNDWNMPAKDDREEKTEGRHEAERFVERLKKGGSWGVYDARNDEDDEDLEENAVEEIGQ